MKHPNHGTVTGRMSATKPNLIAKPKRAGKLKHRITLVHVNQHVIRANAKSGEQSPPLTIRRGRVIERAYAISIQGPCSVVYSPDKPLSCGAKVWIETAFPVLAVEQDKR